jgi:adenosine deaminase
VGPRRRHRRGRRLRRGGCGAHRRGARLSAARRDLRALPKAHLHLHFTGSARVETIRELADKHGLRLPSSLLADWPPSLSARDERGWFRFQRLYDAARAGVRDESDLRRIVREAAADDLAEGSRWLELQVDPTSYAPRLGGLTPALEVVLDEAAAVSEEWDIGVAVVVAASRIRHPLDARTLARLAVQYAGDGPGSVVGFGLSNDERRGATAEFGPAFDLARASGLGLFPHAGELLGPTAVETTLVELAPDRIGHGVRAVEDPRVLELVLEAEVGLEVCPGSNVALGVFPSDAEVPLRTIVDSGIPVALGADDPLLFGSRLLAQYETARDVHGFTDTELADLARGSIRMSRAPELVRARLLTAVDDWLATPA